MRPPIGALGLSGRWGGDRGVGYRNVFELDVEELVDGFEAAGKEEVVFQLDGYLGGQFVWSVGCGTWWVVRSGERGGAYFVVDERAEEAIAVSRVQRDQRNECT